MLTEYEDILGRENLFRNARLGRAEREELLNILLAHCQWVRIYYAWRPNLRDEGDNHLIELAIAGNADYPDEKHLRLKNLAETCGISINQLLNEMTTLLLADFDAETRFQTRAERGRNQSERGIGLLKKAMGE